MVCSSSSSDEAVIGRNHWRDYAKGGIIRRVLCRFRSKKSSELGASHWFVGAVFIHYHVNGDVFFIFLFFFRGHDAKTLSSCTLHPARRCPNVQLISRLFPKRSVSSLSCNRVGGYGGTEVPQQPLHPTLPRLCCQKSQLVPGQYRLLQPWLL